jgi:hypothetical protein
MTTPTTGFEAEPKDVATEVANHLNDITDPSERYSRATAGQAHHEAVARALQTERDIALAQLNAPALGPGKLSYEVLAVRTGLSRSGVQNAVERGRQAVAQRGQSQTSSRAARRPPEATS